MKEIVAVKVDEKIVMDICQRCTMECKIMSVAWTKDFTIYCEAAGLRERARELGLALMEIEIGMGPVEVEI